MSNSTWFFGPALVLSLVLIPQTTSATILTITDGNSILDVDPDPIAEDPSGAVNWVVDGVDHLFRQWFWYRVGPTGGEAAIDTLDLVGTTTFSTNFEPDDNGLFALYSDPDEKFTIDILYVLGGGTPGSGVSDIAEQIRIVNTSTTDTLDFHFFQYSDFDLNDTFDDDTVMKSNTNTVSQTDPGMIVSETVVAPTPSHSEVGLFSDILDRLDDESPTTLTDFGGPLTGDATWAYQWDLTLAPGSSFIISKDKHVQSVPEPSTAVMLGTALFGLLALTSGARKGRPRR